MTGIPGRLLAVNVVHAIIPGPSKPTAIDKRPVSGFVGIDDAGLAGDTQCDRRYHGGRDKAVYAYASEDERWWSGQLDRQIGPGYFGENLTTSGIDVSAAVIGARWRIGGASAGCLLEVTMPRTPCATLAARVGVAKFPQRFTAARRPGAYFRVLSPGIVRGGSRIVITDTPSHGVSVADVIRGLSAAQRERLVDSGLDLAPPVRRLVDRVVARR